MDQLFRVDRVARETSLTLEARHALRNEESKPILERIRSVSKRLESVRNPKVPGPKRVNTHSSCGTDSLASWFIPSWNSVTTRLKTRCARWQLAGRTGSTSEASKRVLGWPPSSRSLKRAADCRFRCANISASYSLAWRTSQQIESTN
jgi:hypothetical protein